jgi:peptidyl-dipeptidase A
MKKIFAFAIVSAALISISFDWKPGNQPDDIKAEAQKYLQSYNSKYQNLLTLSNAAEWDLNTRIIEGDTINASMARQANANFAKFTGSNFNIQLSRKLLAQKDKLDPLQVRQLEFILYQAGANPEPAGDIITRKIALETKQTETLFGFEYKLDGAAVSTNKIDELLRTTNDISKRRVIWEASKEVGKPLKKGLSDLRDLRNGSVKSLGYNDYFSYQVSDYGMNSEQMIALCNGMIKDIWPLYRELHTWARYTLADKYHQPVPEYLPAHWLPNRWGQDWTAMVEVEGLNIDNYLKEKGPEYIVKQGEAFYVSLGFPPLLETFYERSSLYPLPEGSKVKKNNHASAWHIDNDKDVRSLMSVEPNTEWWGTVLHELGHIYYYISYSVPEVPIVLRNGANRGYHEAMGSLIGLASLQKPFLAGRNMVDPAIKTDETKQLLKEALDYIVHIPWGAGTMSQFEYQLYSGNIPEGQFNKTWWDLVKKYQGIVPPAVRGEEYCDAATKTHINNDAAQYYDYSISNVLLFMFHKHIAEEILKQDPRATNYWGSKETGDFLRAMMKTGATQDWREHLKEHLGADMNAKAMLEYFQPLMVYLKEQNKGRKHTLPEKI